MFDYSQAETAASREVARIIEADPELSASEVEKVRLERENKFAWIFVADIPKLIAEGWSPGAITVLIDKQDGHILSEEEETRLHKTIEGSRRRAGFIR